MRNIIKHVSIALILSILIQSICIATDIRDTVRIIEFLDESGNNISALSQDSVLQARAKFSVSTDAILLLGLYRNDRLINVVCGNTMDSLNSITVSIETPNSVSDLTAKAFVWRDFSDSMPMVSAALFPSDNTNLTKLFVEGQELTIMPDIKNYSTQVLPNFCPPFDVRLETEDSSAKVEVFQPAVLPGDITIYITSSSGITDDYTVSVSYKNPETVITYKGSPNTYNIVHNVANGQYTFSDRSNTLTDISSSVIAGATYIQTAVEDRNNATNTNVNTEKWFEIELNCSAEVYVLTRALPSSGIMKWLLNSEWTQVQENGQPVRLKSYDASGWNDMLYLYKRTVIIPGGSTEKVIFGGSGDTNFMYAAAVKWLDTGFGVEIENKLSPYTYNIIDSAKEGDFAFADRNFTLKNIVGSPIDGATYIQTANNDKNDTTNTNPDTPNWVDITLTGPSQLFVITRTKPTSTAMKWLAEDGWTQVRDENGTEIIIQFWNPSANGVEGNMYLFRKLVVAPTGEKQTVSLGGLGINNLMYSIAAKPLKNRNILENLTVNGIEQVMTDNTITLSPNTMTPIEVNTQASYLAGTVDVISPSSLPGQLEVIADRGYGKEYNYYNCVVAAPTVNIVNKVSTNNYNIIDNLQNGTQVFTDRTWTYSDTSILAGATYIQTANNDKDLAVCHDLSVSDYLSVEIDTSSEVYVLVAGEVYYKDRILLWLSGFGELMKDENGANIKLAHSSGNFNIYKRTYVLNPGEKKTVTLGGLGNLKNMMYAVAIKEFDNSAALKSLELNGNVLRGFCPEITEYSAEVFEGAAINVTGEGYYENASLSVSISQTTPKVATINVAGYKGVTKTYSIIIATVNTNIQMTNSYISNIGAELTSNDPIPPSQHPRLYLQRSDFEQIRHNMQSASLTAEVDKLEFMSTEASKCKLLSVKVYWGFCD